jgi:hypothetical protein
MSCGCARRVARGLKRRAGDLVARFWASMVGGTGV